MINFIIGLSVGATLGMFIMALIAANGDRR